MLLSASELIQKSIELYKQNGKLFATYAGLSVLPFFILETIALVAFPQTQEVNDAALLLPGSIALLIAYVIGGVFSIWVSIALLRVISVRTKGLTPKPVREELMASRAFLLPSIIAAILAGLAVLFGLALLIVPGVIFAVWFCFISQAVALDGISGKDSLKYSKRLVAGRWSAIFWRIFAMGAIFILFAFIPQMLLSAIFDALFRLVGSSGSTILPMIFLFLTSLSNFLISALTGPFGAAGQVILYEEAKKTVNSTT